MNRIVYSFWCLVLCAAQSQAIPVKKTDFAQLMTAASAVIGAQVVAVTPSTKTPEVYGYPSDGLSVFEAHLRVESIYKGNIPSKDIAVFFLRAPADPGAFVDLEVSSAYVFFLQSIEPVPLLTDVQNGAFQVDLAALRETSLEPASQLESLFQRSARSSDFDVVVKALQALAYVGTSNSLPLAEHLVASTNDEVRLAAATAAVKLGNWKRIEDIVALWEARSYGNDGFIGFRDHNLAAASWAAVREVSTKDAYPLVSRMLQQTKSTHIKRTLIRTLLNIDDPQGVGVVAPFIEDDDSRVAYEAYTTVMKLRGRPRVTPELFERNKLAIKDEIQKLTRP